MRLSQQFKKHGSSKSGSSLVVVLILAIIVFIAVTASFKAVVFQLRMTDRSLNFKQAFALAEAGVENAICELNKSQGQWSEWSSDGGYTLTQTRNDHAGDSIGQFSVTVINAAGGAPVIESTGYVPSINNPKVIRTLRVNAEVDTEPSFFKWGIYAYEELKVSSNFYMDSYRSSEGIYPGEFNANQNGNVGGAASVDAYWGSVTDILGSVQVGGTIDAGNNFDVTGDIIENDAGTPPPIFPDAALDAAKDSNDNDQITINGNPFGGGTVLDVNSNKTIVFPPGVYYFKEIKLASNIKIRVEPAGEVEVYVKAPSGDKAIEIQSNTHINQNTKIPGNFKFFVKRGDVIYQSNETSYATVFAPNSLVSMQSNLEWYGAFVGDLVEIQSNQSIHYDEDLANPAGATGGAIIKSWMEISPQK